MKGRQVQHYRLQECPKGQCAVVGRFGDASMPIKLWLEETGADIGVRISHGGDREHAMISGLHLICCCRLHNRAG